jgi:hypothetical protein
LPCNHKTAREFIEFIEFVGFLGFVELVQLHGSVEIDGDSLRWIEIGGVRWVCGVVWVRPLTLALSRQGREDCSVVGVPGLFGIWALPGSPRLLRPPDSSGLLAMTGGSSLSCLGFFGFVESVGFIEFIEFVGFVELQGLAPSL